MKGKQKKQFSFSKPILILFCSFFLFFQQCRTTKSISESSRYIPKKDNSLNYHIDTSILNFNYLASKISLKTNLNGQRQNFNANMRWKKNEQIWLSFSIFGFEGVRISITPDSIKIIDRLNKQYYLEPYAYLKEKATIDVSFTELENILEGKLIKMNTNQSNITALENGDYQLMYNEKTFNNEVILDSLYLLPKTMTIKENSTGKSLFTSFGDYIRKDGQLFSMKRVINAIDLNNILEVEAKFEQIEVKNELSFPFEINQNFTRAH